MVSNPSDLLNDDIKELPPDLSSLGRIDDNSKAVFFEIF